MDRPTEAVMIVHWKRASEALRAAMLAHELRLPERPIADGRWHECGGGQYLLLPDVLIAIFCGGEDASPVVRQHEPRLLTLALEQRIADAIARRPVLMQRSSSILQARDDRGSNHHAKKP